MVEIDDVRSDLRMAYANSNAVSVHRRLAAVLTSALDLRHAHDEVRQGGRRGEGIARAKGCAEDDGGIPGGIVVGVPLIVEVGVHGVGRDEICHCHGRPAGQGGDREWGSSDGSEQRGELDARFCQPWAAVVAFLALSSPTAAACRSASRAGDLGESPAWLRQNIGASSWNKDHLMNVITLREHAPAVNEAGARLLLLAPAAESPRLLTCLAIPTPTDSGKPGRSPVPSDGGELPVRRFDSQWTGHPDTSRSLNKHSSFQSGASGARHRSPFPDRIGVRLASCSS